MKKQAAVLVIILSILMSTISISCSNQTVPETTVKHQILSQSSRQFISAKGYTKVGITAGLKKDGTINATGFDYAQQTNSWKDIISVSAGGGHLLGLKSDGSVLAVGFPISSFVTPLLSLSLILAYNWIIKVFLVP